MDGLPCSAAERPATHDVRAHFCVTQLCDLLCPAIVGSKRGRECDVEPDAAAEAAARGTATHRAIERALRGGPRDATHAAACAHALRFGAVIGGHLVAIEEPVLTPDRELVGIPDAVYDMPDGSCAIVDWKDSERIDANASRRMSAPFDQLPRCALARYALQVSMYGRLLERFRERRVSALYVCNVRSGRLYDLPYLRAEANFLIDVAIDAVHRRAREFPLCEVDGKTAIHPVLCRDGLVRSRLCALDRAISFVENVYLSSRAWSALQTAIDWDARVRRFRTSRRSHVWRMPREGVSVPAPWFANWEPSFF